VNAPLDSNLLFSLPKDDLVALVFELSDRLNAEGRRIEQVLAANVALAERVKELEARINKDSHNSSKPPSSDGLSKKPCPKSLRKEGAKRSGGQPGHPGKTLHLSEAPTQTVPHAPSTCSGCGHGLDEVDACGSERRQVFDLPKLDLDIIEHLSLHKTCPGCGQLNRGAFPDGVAQPVQYGPKVKSVLVYLTNYQLLPWERATKMLSDLYGASLSQGVLQNALQQCKQALDPITQTIKDSLVRAKLAHFDETGLRVEGSLRWLHVASNQTLTHYERNDKRGQIAMDEIGILPEFQGKAVHDGLRSYFAYDCSHQLCNAHHLRELTFLVEQHQQVWAQEMKTLLVQIKEQVDTARQQGLVALNLLTTAMFENRYSKLIGDGYAENPEAERTGKRGRPAQSKGRNLVNRLDQNRAAVLAFMYDFEVPFDNNLAERDLRMIKVRQKISGAFRTSQGADTFAQIRGYISTMRKQGHNPLDVLERVFLGNPRAPAC